MQQKQTSMRCDADANFIVDRPIRAALEPFFIEKHQDVRFQFLLVRLI